MEREADNEHCKFLSRNEEVIIFVVYLTDFLIGQV